MATDTDTPSDTATDIDRWAADAAAWLSAQLPLADEDDADGAQVDLSIFHDLSHDEEVALLARAREWRRALYDAGYGALTTPVEHGGAGLTAEHAEAFGRELSRYRVPTSTELISVTTKLVGPTVAQFGTPAQRERFLVPLLRTDILACQLFSEPGAGSDLAAVACRAQREGDAWRIDGQKIWSSGAQFSDWGLLLARTDPTVRKHAGMTMFLVPMDAPGVEVRPIRQMSGGASFNEVFLDGVVVEDALRIGDEGQGWAVANATLGMERTASGEVQRRKGGSFEDLLALARRFGATDDPLVRQRLADVYVRLQLRQATTDRVARRRAAGRSGGAAASIGKVVASDNLMRIGDVAAAILGPQLAADTGEAQTFGWTAHLLGAPGYRLAGGTDEIQRTIIGERVLGLPREPAVDGELPFQDLPRG